MLWQYEMDDVLLSQGSGCLVMFELAKETATVWGWIHGRERGEEWNGLHEGTESDIEKLRKPVQNTSHSFQLLTIRLSFLDLQVSHI